MNLVEILAEQTRKRPRAAAIMEMRRGRDRVTTFAELEERSAKVARLLSPFEEALLLHERGDAKAAELYREAIAEGDNLADAYCNLGIIELELDRMPKALDCFSLALKNEPRQVVVRFWIIRL